MYPHLVPPVAFPDVQHGEKYRNILRKSPSSFSWDWGPAFIPSGIWKPVRLVYNQDLHVSSVDVRNGRIDTSSWNVAVSLHCIEMSARKTVPDVSYELESLNHGTKSPGINSSSVHFEKENDGMLIMVNFIATDIRMWYPRGFGDQNLYNLTLIICSCTGCINSYRILGFRTVELNQDVLNTNDTSQRKFEFVINGRPVYIKGANMVPLSVFEGGYNSNISRNKLLSNAFPHDVSIPRDPVTIIELFDRVEFGGINTLRVWGGGVYREDEFYEEADRRGIMIWQVS